MLIFTESFKKRELKKVAEYFTLLDFHTALDRLKSSGVAMNTLGFKDCKIFKVRIGSKPVGRLIIFLEVKKSYFIPIVIRLKKDKTFGQNLSLENSAAKNLIIANILRALEDLKNGRYQKI